MVFNSQALIYIDPAKGVTCVHTDIGWIPLTYFPKVPFNLPFEGHRLVVARGQLYLVGGRFMTDLIQRYARQPTLIESCDFLFRYDADSNKWEQKEGMGVARSHSATVSLGDYIYVIGGWSSVSNVTDVQRFNLNTEKWESLAPMPVPCSLPVAVVHNGKILVYGVESMERRRRGHLMFYDHIDNKWQVLNSENLPSSSRRVSMAPLLVINREKCYRVSYMNGIACVQQIILDAGEEMLSASIGEPEDVKGQEDMAKRAPRAFCIDTQQHANLNGYAYKLSAFVLKDFESCDNLKDMVVSVPNESCMIECRLDTFTLMGKFYKEWNIMDQT